MSTQVFITVFVLGAGLAGIAVALVGIYRQRRPKP
jgi:branched-subunit amino acid ABC-type transport system permease component